MRLERETECTSDATPALLVLRKESLQALALPEKLDKDDKKDKPLPEPGLAGMVPIAGLRNAADVDFDGDTREIYFLQVG